MTAAEITALVDAALTPAERVALAPWLIAPVCAELAWEYGDDDETFPWRVAESPHVALYHCAHVVTMTTWLSSSKGHQRGCGGPATAGTTTWLSL
jgi:hypothetical protein